MQGSVEVLSEMLPKLSTDQVKLKILGSGVGAVSENDVLLASASGAIIIAFGVRPERKAADLAQQEGVDIRAHNIIYEVSDEIKKAMEGLLEPVFQESYLGRAEVRNTFRVKGAGTIAGCYVVDGILKRDAQIRVVREGAVIYTSKLSSLKRFKDDASEVRTGFECGVGIANFNDVKIGDSPGSVQRPETQRRRSCRPIRHLRPQVIFLECGGLTPFFFSSCRGPPA